MSAVFESLFKRYPELVVCQQDIVHAYEVLRESFAQGGKLLVCGNGGSASDSEHIVGELMKGFMQKRALPMAVQDRLRAVSAADGDHLAKSLQGALPAISLVSQSALISAVANDIDAALVFAQQVYGYGRKGDAVLGISTSGNSKNVVSAMQVGKVMGLATVGLTGETGGLLAGVCDVVVRVPYTTTPEIQERHLPIYHALCIALEEAFF